MKKALVLLGAAALALVLFAGCQQEVLDANIKDMPSGEGNHDFEDETLTFTMTGAYILKTTDVNGGTAESRTEEKIPLTTFTRTVTFNDDGTLTWVDTEAWAAGADATYTDTTTGTTVVTDVYYEYNTGDTNLINDIYGINDGDSADGHIWTGFSGRTIRQTTTTGTWETFKEKTDGTTTYTLDYKLTFGNEVEVLTVANPNFAGAATYSAATGTDTSTEPNDSWTHDMAYYYKGKDADDNLLYYIDIDSSGSGDFFDGVTFTVTEN